MSDRFAAMRARSDIQSLCHAGYDAAALRRELLRRLKPVLDFDACSLMTIDPATNMVTSSVTHGLSAAGARPLFTNEYMEEDFSKLADLARGPHHAAILYQATGGAPARSRRYRDLLPRVGIGHELRAAFVLDGACWGGALVYRFRDRAPFTPVEAVFLESVGPHIAAGLRAALLLAQAQGAAEAPGAEGPGLLLLGDGARVLSISEPAERYLHTLGEEWRAGELPAPIYALEAHARALARGVAPKGAGPARLRIPTPGGQWLAFHATTMPGDGDLVAVMVEKAHPAEVAPIIFDAYGLTPREREVAQRVLTGLSTREIAEALFLSEHTVQDHLKAVFTKTGVSSRRELSGRIFFGAYFPEMRP
ncbi:MAG TPA: LuxR C-terminal-related transcriptional regulator [Symbiobacteriaceae bacterium]|nr:LuxR C-terminal-related transcriptional regulator [Symbiobacteriaceae bacterium]